jgi:hypothetical protein
MECHGVENFLLSLEDQFSISQANGSKITHASTCGMVQQYRVLLLRRYPHQTTRSVLLKMDLIGRPQIDSWIDHERPEFFYMPPAMQDRPWRLEGAACADESQEI